MLAQGWRLPPYASPAAARYGHLDILKWMQANDRILHNPIGYICREAALRIQLAELQWARGNSFDGNYSTSSGAARSSHLGMLKWAQCNGCPCDESTCSREAAAGHLDILQWVGA